MLIDDAGFPEQLHAFFHPTVAVECSDTLTKAEKPS